jgi:hypothetical protein
MKMVSEARRAVARRGQDEGPDIVTEAKTRTGVEPTNRDPVELSDSLVLKVEGIEFLYALTERCAQLLGVDRRESRARRLWPRNLLTPIVTDMALTPADRASWPFLRRHRTLPTLQAYAPHLRPPNKFVTKEIGPWRTLS